MEISCIFSQAHDSTANIDRPRANNSTCLDKLPDSVNSIPDSTDNENRIQQNRSAPDHGQSHHRDHLRGDCRIGFSDRLDDCDDYRRYHDDLVYRRGRGIGHYALFFLAGNRLAGLGIQSDFVADLTKRVLRFVAAYFGDIRFRFLLRVFNTPM